MPKVSRILTVFQKARGGRVVSVTFDGATTQGLVGAVRSRNAWQVQGYGEDYETSVWIEAGSLPGVESMKSVTIDGETKRVLATNPDSVGALVRLDLGDRYARG